VSNSYKKAKENHEKALSLRLQLFGNQSNEVANSYLNLGNVYSKIDNKETISYYEKAKEIYEKNNNPMYWTIISNEVIIYENLNDYEKAIEKCNLFLAEEKNPSEGKIKILIERSKCFKSKSNYQKANEDLLTARDIVEYSILEQAKRKKCLYKIYQQQGDILLEQKSNLAENYYLLALTNASGIDSKTICWKQLGDYYTTFNDYSKALFYTNQALTTNWNDSVSTFEELLKIGKIYAAQAKFDTAINYYHFALQQFKINSIETINVEHPQEIINACIAIAQAKYKLGTVATWNEGVYYAQCALTQASFLLKNQSSVNAKLLLKNNLAPSYEVIILCNLAQGKKEEAFNHVQQYKQQIERKDIQNFHMAEIQSTIKKQQTLISYFCGTDSIYIFVINRNGFNVIPVAAAQKIHQQAEELYYSLNLQKQPLRTMEGYDKNTTQITENSYALFQELIFPVKQYLNKELIIEPDAQLYFLPFEVLLSEKPEVSKNFNSHKYLIKEYSIRYIYSTYNKELTSNFLDYFYPKKVLGFAPDFSKSQLGFPPLYQNEEELKYISNNWNGLFFTKNEAVKSNFLSLADQYDIIHLSTHGEMQEEDDSSFVAFTEVSEATQNNILTASEIKQLRHFDADLVVLSACQTGGGSIYHGEGMMSVGKAFLDVGAHHFIASIWNADEGKAFEMTKMLYKKLSSNASISNALQQTKIALIEDSSNEFAHPYYWAGFVVVGDGKEIKQISFLSIGLLAFGLLMMLLLLKHKKRISFNKISQIYFLS
jgi:CHAT domain-containing protein/tetratricopeptide (TPR) repeat protein